MWRGTGKCGILLLAASLALAAPAHAQLVMPKVGQSINFGQTQPPPEEEAPRGLGVAASSVSFIDSAIPLKTLRLRYEYNDRMQQPTRGEFFHPKPGRLGGRGGPLIDTNQQSHDLMAHAEFAPAEWFSTFIEWPFRMLNPDTNANATGLGDVNYGVKLVTWSDENIVGTLQLRIFNPSARADILGTRHWSVEPAFLGAWHPVENLQLDGEVRYFVPITRHNDFAGSLLRYGVGVTLGERKDKTWWFQPVLEGVGYSILSGQTVIADSAEVFRVASTRNKTIVNAYAGVRMGKAERFDLYVGYGRALTNERFYRDTVRVELRWLY